MTPEYTDEFYQGLREGVRRSAQAIVPIVLDLIGPQSVVDVGCGTGTWLSVFREHGVTDILGIDGSYVNPRMLEIPVDRFLACDLREPLHVDRQFDLVVSLEVAEHLPDDSAETFIDSLTRLGSAILFSAAVPFQGGTHHVNEQWPDYWARYFRARGFLVVDMIRKRVWENADVDFWYIQNSLVFVRREDIDRYPLLHEEIRQTREEQLALVHPRLFLDIATSHVAVSDACKTHEAAAEALKPEARDKDHKEQEQQ